MSKKEGQRFVQRRRHQWKSKRRLSARDIAVLDFLWTWKVASTPLLKEVAFRDKSQWWVYKALHQLQKERYIQSLPRGKFLEAELWALTDIGFEVVLMDRDDLNQYRFKPHAPVHDYLATCLQLGEQSFKDNNDKQFFTEQMLSSLTNSNFPNSFKTSESHIPDGLTLYRNNDREALVAYEVDLNLKERDRYQNTFFYYCSSASPHLLVWLVKNNWIAEKIIQTFKSFNFEDRTEKLLSRTAFITLDEFKEKVWEVESFIGDLKGHSIRKLHENALQSIGKTPEKIVQNDLKSIFFPKYKSPQKIISYTSPTAIETY